MSLNKASLVLFSVSLKKASLVLFSVSLKKASLGLFSVSLKFNLTSVTLKPLGPLATPDCFQFRVVVKFDNADHDGQVRVTSCC
jgi:hypothetical protein